MAWTKVEKTRRGLGAGMAPRTSFAVRRGRTGHQAATFIIPEGEVHGSRASIYSDGNGKLAFRISDKGDFSAFKGKNQRVAQVSIPARMASRIPFGTHDAEVTRDGDMLVLDLTQFAQ